MKILKYVFFLLLIVVIGGAIYFGTQDGSYNVSQSKIIDAPASVVYDNVKDFKNWQEWGPWMEQDPDIKINYAEKTAGEGASYSWESDDMEVGDGSMETIKAIPNASLEQKILFDTPIGESTSDVTWTFEETDTPGQSKVTWTMKGESSLLEKVFLSFGDEDLETSISEMYTTGLNNLEKVVLEELKVYSINVDGATLYGGGFYMYNTTAAKMEDVGAKMAPLLGQVMGFMQSNNIAMAGAPFTIYNQVNDLDGTVIFSTGIPVKEKIATPQGSPVLNGYMEPVTAVKTTLKGDYKNLTETYAKTMQYLQENGYTAHPTAKMFEVYMTDPGEVPNPADWITHVYVPIVTPTAPVN